MNFTAATPTAPNSACGATPAATAAVNALSMLTSSNLAQLKCPAHANEAYTSFCNQCQKMLCVSAPRSTARTPK